MLGGDIVAEVSNASCKRELLVVVWRERYCFLTLAVVQRDIRYIGDISLQGHRKGNLYVFTTKLLVAEHEGVIVECLSDNGSPVERCAEMDDGYPCLGYDGFQHLIAS